MEQNKIIIILLIVAVILGIVLGLKVTVLDNEDTEKNHVKIEENTQMKQKQSNKDENNSYKSKNIIYKFGLIVSNLFRNGIVLIILGVWLASIWKIFTNEGLAGWIALIPIYNIMKLYEISGMTGWWALLTLIPFVGSIFAFIFTIMLASRMANKYNKNTFFALGLLVFPYIFYPILAFSKK